MTHIFLLSFKHILLYPADNTDVLLTRTQTLTWPAKRVCAQPQTHKDYSCLTPQNGQNHVFLFN